MSEGIDLEAIKRIIRHGVVGDHPGNYGGTTNEDVAEAADELIGEVERLRAKLHNSVELVLGGENETIHVLGPPSLVEAVRAQVKRADRLEQGIRELVPFEMLRVLDDDEMHAVTVRRWRAAAALLDSDGDSDRAVVGSTYRCLRCGAVFDHDAPGKCPRAPDRGTHEALPAVRRGSSLHERGCDAPAGGGCTCRHARR